MKTSNAQLSRPMRLAHGTLLAAACVLGLGLAAAPAASALTAYSVKGEFEEHEKVAGLAVDQSNDHVYVTVSAGFGTKGVFQFDSLGKPVVPTPFVAAGIFGVDYLGIAVDPENRNVYVYDGEGQEIDTFEPSGTKLRSFTVNGGRFTNVQIASDPSGNIYYPNQATKSIQKFAPTAEGAASPTSEFNGVPVGHGLVNPQGVAVDSTHNLVYVVDSGSVQVFEPGFFLTTWQGTLDSGGSQDVAVDPVNDDVYVLDDGTSGYHVVAYHYGEKTPFADFGLGTIGAGSAPNHVAVDHKTGYVYVSDVGNEKVWIFEPGVPPEVAYPAEPNLVTDLTASHATLHGEVNPNGNEVFYHFEYGTTTSNGTSVPLPYALVGEGAKFKPESVTITGLEANTTYHFRLVATNAAGEPFAGADETFTTPMAPPVVLTGSVLASNVTQGDVLFNAAINPQNPAETHVLNPSEETHARWWFNYSRQALEDASGCAPSVPYASAPATPIQMGAHTVAEEAAGIPVSLDLAGASVVLHPGMGSRELQPNTVYRFQVVAENVTENINTRTVEKREVSCQPEASFITLPPSPLATTGGASAVTQTAASVAGSVTPGSTGPNSDTSWSFQYGTSTSYGHSAPSAAGDAGMGTSAVTVSTALEGLAPNTTYHYRVVASNANHDSEARACASAGEAGCAPQLVRGKDQTFTTLPVLPFAGQPSGLSETGVTLNGDVNPSGHPLEYRFQYGSTEAYGQSTGLGSAGEGTEYTPVSATLTGLAPGTYHWRVVAVGAGGSTYSADSTFTLYAPAPQPGSNPFTPGTGSASVLGAIPLLSVPSFPPPPATTVEPAKRPKPKLSCQAKAKRIKNARQRKAALRRCVKSQLKARKK